MLKEHRSNKLKPRELNSENILKMSRKEKKKRTLSGMNRQEIHDYIHKQKYRYGYTKY